MGKKVDQWNQSGNTRVYKDISGLIRTLQYDRRQHRIAQDDWK